MDARVGKIRAMIYEQYKNQRDFASALGWKDWKLNRIVNGKQVPTINDASEIAKCLGIDISRVIEIFLR